MRRKQLAILMAAVAVLAMPVNAMASGSISGAVDYNNVTATTESGEETETDGAAQDALVGGNDRSFYRDSRRYAFCCKRGHI